MSDHQRLSDRIADALELCMEQGDMTVAAPLHQALELALTRKTGGVGFIEKRGELAPNVIVLIDKFQELKSTQS